MLDIPSGLCCHLTVFNFGLFKVSYDGDTELRVDNIS